MTETSNPQAVRREVVFSEAIFDREKDVEGLRAKRVESVDHISEVWGDGKIPILIDPDAKGKDFLKPNVLIDATLSKKNLGTKITDASLVIGLGPGFHAGKDVHLVIETNRGHDLGRIISNGEAEPNTGIPGSIAGYTEERVIRAPKSGNFKALNKIGDGVRANEKVGMVGNVAVQSRIAGVIREIKRELEFTSPTLSKKPDHITLPGSGEPTLNQHIGEIIYNIKELTSIPLAVLTNGCLFPLEEVREALVGADLVIPSLDAVNDVTFQCLNRPHPSLKIDEIISGLIQFRKQYRGQIWLEVVFCRGIDDDQKEIESLKGVIDRIQPNRVQLNTPVRPPAEEFAYPLTTNQLEEIRKKLGDKAEIISEFAVSLGEEFNSLKDSEIQGLIKRRPCTTEDISKALGFRMDEVVKHLDHLRKTGAVRYRMYDHRCYYESGLTH